MIIYIAPLTAIVGMLIYAFSSNPKAAEIGRLAFACGCLATLLLLDGAHSVHFP
jgi:hypothetical protein